MKIPCTFIASLWLTKSTFNPYLSPIWPLKCVRTLNIVLHVSQNTHMQKCNYFVKWKITIKMKMFKSTWLFLRITVWSFSLFRKFKLSQNFTSYSHGVKWKLYGEQVNNCPPDVLVLHWNSLNFIILITILMKFWTAFFLISRIMSLIHCVMKYIVNSVKIVIWIIMWKKSTKHKGFVVYTGKCCVWRI